MLVRKGNAFYEIDEDCMKKKGLQLPTEEEGTLLTYGEARDEKQDQKDIQKRETSVRKRNV